LFYIEASRDGINWKYIDGWWGTTNGWIPKSYPLTDYDNSPYFNIRFGLATDGNTPLSSSSSVYLGRVSIYAFDPESGEQHYFYDQGTSMATPYVSGIAGLVKSMHPDYTNFQIKDAILKSIDVKSSLYGKILTEGRVNANKAIFAVPAPSQPLSITSVRMWSNLPQHFERGITHTITANTQIAPYAVPYDRWELWHQSTL